MQTRSVNETMSDETKASKATQASRYRSQVARCPFLTQDSDMMFTVNELDQRMSDPTQQSLIKLKRLVLKRETRKAMGGKVATYSEATMKLENRQARAS